MRAYAVVLLMVATVAPLKADEYPGPQFQYGLWQNEFTVDTHNVAGFSLAKGFEGLKSFSTRSVWTNDKRCVNPMQDLKVVFSGHSQGDCKAEPFVQVAPGHWQSPRRCEVSRPVKTDVFFMGKDTYKIVNTISEYRPINNRFVGVGMSKDETTTMRYLGPGTGSCPPESAQQTGLEASARPKPQLNN